MTICSFCGNKRFFFLLLLLSLTAHGQEQKRLAILPTVDDGEPQVEPTDLYSLTQTLREIAGNILQGHYGIMTEQSIIDKLGKDNAVKECKAAEGCLAQLGRKINADYIGQARLGRLGGNFFISVELYNSASGLQASPTITGNAKDLFGLLNVLNEKAPGMFKKMPGVSSGKQSPAFESGIGGVQTSGGDYELKEKLYRVNLSTEPSGAILSFNGEPDTRKTPYSIDLAAGNVRIIAALDQYEKADTTVSIKQNNQSINIKLKQNFGVLEIKPAYLDGIGKNEQWSLLINGKAVSSWENNLPANKYKVELTHRCYENISFDAGISKGRREVFDMSAHIKLKKGGLVLKAERNGESASEPVYINGKQSGETPFSGTVPLCANIEIGKSREKVDVVLKHNDKVTHTVKSGNYKSATISLDSIRKVIEDSIRRYAPMPTTASSLKDPRDNKTYKVVKIGNQVWMAENLNYNASGSKCYENKDSNCQKYGRLYNWNTAKTACPSGWHLPSKAEWEVLTEAVGGEKTEGKHLKANSSWRNGYGEKPGNGLDTYGFSALPSGYGSSSGYFTNVGGYGGWWSANEKNSNNAYYRRVTNYSDDAIWDNLAKNYLFSVRCLQD